MSSFYGNLGGSGGGGGNANERVLTEEEYNALSEEEKMNNTTYYINDIDAGGEGGGHTILNDDGTELAQEDNLQFKGVYSADNAVSGTTEVNIYREMTKAEFDLLSNDEKKGFINIIDEPDVTNVVIQPVIYSTEEKEVGVWTNGKPLYQRTYEITQMSIYPSGTAIAGIDISEMDTMIKAEGVDSTLAQSAPLLVYRNNGLYASCSLASLMDRITLWYTKLADTPGSGSWTPQGTPAIHYNTDEHVIGTWIDGSTLYERTIFTNPTWSNNTASIQLTNEICKSIEGGVCDSSGGNLIPFGYATSSEYNEYVRIYQGVNALAIWNSFSASRDYVQMTIRYTKSS